MGYNSLSGKRVIITGGASGIGRAAVERFVAEGAKVAVWDVKKYEGAKQVFYTQCNVAHPDDVALAMQTTLEAFGGVDVLINNAGITRDASFLKMTNEQWQEVLEVNLSGVFHCCKVVTPHLVSQNSGSVINTSSVVGLYGNYGQANYAAAKSGLIAFTKTLARELGRYNIRVNVVAPGFIATDMVSTVPEKVLQKLRERVPLGRLGTAEEVAGIYAFLASDEAKFITGTVISVDGGMTI
ncbi:MAG: beta-ketoacyl-ACP reductase [Chitinophagales bacterium]|nr:beta-ketoacyl-ACP reductase [Chitinophagales bacterium]MDW8419395.1 beta-ketoacyl-ACP reductase [Chitinophagales bacterium]